MTIIRNSWLLIVLPCLMAFFAYTTAVNWQVGVLRGGGAVIELPLLEFSMTAGQFFGACLVALGWLQFMILPALGWAMAERRFVELCGVVLLGILCVAVGMSTGVAYQSAAADLMQRRGDAVRADFNATSVEVAKLSEKTHEIAPRSAAVIIAERSELLTSHVKHRGKLWPVNKTSAGCTNNHIATRLTCAKVLALSTELARARDYNDNSKKLEAAQEKRDRNWQLDPAKLFTPFKKRLGAEPEQVIEGQSYGFQMVNELVSLLIIPLIMMGLRASNGGGGRNATPPGARDRAPDRARKPDTQDAAQVAAQDAGLSHDQTRRAARNVIDFAEKRRDKYHSIIEYARVAHGGWMNVEPFMDDYREFCAERGIKPLAKNVVGAVLLQCGGERRVNYEPRPYGTSPVTYWRIGGGAVKLAGEAA